MQQSQSALANLQVSFTYKDLLFRKLYNAIVCSVLSQLLILHLCLILINGDPLNPLSWLRTSFNTITSFTAWLYVIPHMTIIFAQCLICARDYVLSSSFSSTRFQKLISVFSLHNLVLLVLHTLIGIVQVWLILSLAGGDYSKITKVNSENQSVLVEETLYLFLSGLWVGIYYFAKVYVADKHLVFPVIQKRKLAQFKSNLFPLLKESLKKSMWSCFYFVSFYYVWRNSIKQNFMYIFNSSAEDGFHMNFYFYHWLLSALYFFNMNLIKLFFGLFLTEPIEFPLVKLNQNVLTLQDSINLQNLPIVQSLACLDLYLLSLWAPVRRQILFTISQPGAHPHNWNSLIEATMKLYDFNIKILERSTDSISEKVIFQANPLMQNQKPVPNKFRDLRNMTSPYTSPDTARLLDITNPKLPATQEVQQNIKNKIQTKITTFISIIKTISGINYLFGELPQANIQKCLSDGHMIIWSSRGLSQLICASLSEDRYGVVQKDLPQVITTLVHLNQVLDKLNKVPALSMRIVGADNFNYKIKSAISASLKRNLFHICNTFRQYLHEIPLSKEVSSYLHSSVLVKN